MLEGQYSGEPMQVRMYVPGPSPSCGLRDSTTYSPSCTDQSCSYVDDVVARAQMGTPPGVIGRSSSTPQLHGMKIRRTNSKSYSGRNLASYVAHPSYDRTFRDGVSLSSRLRVLSFYLTVFISGCLLTGFLLSMSPQQTLERSSSRLMLQHPAGTVHRRGLYTAGTGGEWKICAIWVYLWKAVGSTRGVDHGLVCARIWGSWLCRTACWCTSTVTYMEICTCYCLVML